MPALLVGPSSTGKTMAAAWPATGLGLPLYRVDLAAAISKYIGETEKYLAELLAHAESAEVILLLDFPIPRPEERLLLWQPRVGARHRLRPRELNLPAASADLCGGAVRNVVLAAAVLAWERDVFSGSRPKFSFTNWHVYNR